jgi:hypothetical protein
LDCTGALVGAWRVFELFDEFEEFEEPDEFEEFEFDELDEFDEPEEPELLAGLEFEPALPALDVALPEDDVPVLVLAFELPELVLVCVEPGSTAATAPAASTLAKPTVAVAVFSLRLPRSRSATARDTWRSPARVRGGPVLSSQLSIGRSVACLLVRVV